MKRVTSVVGFSTLWTLLRLLIASAARFEDDCRGASDEADFGGPDQDRFQPVSVIFSDGNPSFSSRALAASRKGVKTIHNREGVAIVRGFN